VLKQLETEAITADQLITEKDTIYASLIKIEGKCIAVCEKYIECDPSNREWQEMLSLHQTLIYQHLDLFLVTQHPSADTELKGFPKEYKMTARLWIHGIHSILELLRKRLPGSQNYMRSFFCLVYTTMTILLESVNGFGETWIECLGDLARYRMAMEESDMTARNNWAGVSRHWYNAVADHSPEEGRIQHHLAVLARPDMIRQLFYYTKALLSVRPFRQTRESMIHLFSASNAQDALNEHKVPTTFIAVHAALFNKWSSDRFIHLANHFLFLLREESRLLGYDVQTCVYIMSCNLASILEYGDPAATLEMDFGKKDCALLVVPSSLSLDLRSASYGRDHSQQVGGPTDLSVHLPPTTARASALTFHTLSVFLDNIDDHSFYAVAHISMSFVRSLAAHPTTMQQVYKVIPWAKIVKFLNSHWSRDQLPHDRRAGFSTGWRSCSPTP
jgi:hypothetical protein